MELADHLLGHGVEALFLLRRGKETGIGAIHAGGGVTRARSTVELVIAGVAGKAGEQSAGKGVVLSLWNAVEGDNVETLNMAGDAQGLHLRERGAPQYLVKRAERNIGAHTGMVIADPKGKG